MLGKVNQFLILECMDYVKYTFEQVKIQPEDPEDDYEISYLDRCGISTQKYAIVGKFKLV